jgi:hypothetical protein
MLVTNQSITQAWLLDQGLGNIRQHVACMIGKRNMALLLKMNSNLILIKSLLNKCSRG